MRRALPLVVLSTVLHAVDASAGGLAWEAPEPCPSAEMFVAKVAETLGRPVPEDVGITLTAAQVGARWRVTIVSAEGERELDAASCQELADAAALIVAMAIEDAAAAAPPPPTIPADAGDAPPLPDLRRAQVDDTPRAPARPLDVDLRFRAVVGGDLGTLPAASGGVGGAVEIVLGAFSVDALLERFLERRLFAPGSDAMGADVSLTTVALRGCWTGGRRWRAGACVGADLVLIHAAGFGFDDNAAESTTPGGGAQGGLAWAYRVAGPLALRADVTATWLMVRPVLVREDDGTILHDPNSLVWRGFAGVEATWR